jgi:IclR family mhp operon transcriptional activator
MSGGKTASYPHVQALARGLSVLRALNRCENGWASIRELALATDLNRSTVRRLLETLCTEGLVRRSPSDDSFRLTRDVLGLSEGFCEDEWIARIAAPVLGDLLKKVVWPSDLLTLEGDTLLIRESTHRFSPLSFHRHMVRGRLPLLSTAAGRVYLAFCPPDERRTLIERALARSEPLPLGLDGPGAIERMLETIRRQGYGVNLGEWAEERQVAAIAAPIRRGEAVLACLNIIMLKKAVTIDDAITRHLPALLEAVAEIEAALDVSARIDDASCGSNVHCVNGSAFSISMPPPRTKIGAVETGGRASRREE